MTAHSWKNVLRVAHLQGGLRAVNPPGSEVIIEPNTIHNKVVHFNIPSYPTFVAVLRDLKLELIGIDFYTTKEEIEGTWPPEWSSFGRMKNPNYPLNDSFRAWNNLSFSASTQQDYCLADIAGRIGFELKACETRLRELSESYRRELVARCKNKVFEDGQRFETLNSFNIYLAVHSFLVESCSLRDYLAEFMRRYVFQKYQDIKVSTMASLRKYILKKEHEHDSFAKELYEATDPESPDAWLAKLGAYRDLVVHSVPIAQARTRTFLVQKLSSLNNDKFLPSIALPLPSDPGNLSKKRSEGFYFSNFDEWFMAVQEDAEESQRATDALEYCSFVNGNLIKLATTLVQYSPIKPETPTIKAENIIEMQD